MKKSDLKQIIKEEIASEMQAKEAAKKYSTKTVKGFKPWDQFNQQEYEAFLAGVKWATQKTLDNLTPNN